jgi:ABC-type sulfate transport system substrate-binding protein
MAAFSGAREALGNRVANWFERQQQRAGRPVDVASTFAGSEALTEAILAGQIVDVAAMASAYDVARLVAAGLVARDWTDRPHGGVFSRSLVVIAVRAGNPLGIHGFADLARPGLRIVTADPNTSGAGLWGLCALYGSALRGHAGLPHPDDASARAFVTAVRANIVVEPGSADEAYRTFLAGTGDVAITYESEVALGALFGHDAIAVVPPSTILVENVAVLIERDLDARGTRSIAEALLTHLWSDEAQQRLAQCGLRPVAPHVAARHAAHFPEPTDLWTIEFLGGWGAAAKLTQELLRPPAAKPSR